MTIRAGQFLGDSTSRFIRPSKFRRLQQLYRKVGKALLSHFTAKAHDLLLICLSVEATQESRPLPGHGTVPIQGTSLCSRSAAHIEYKWKVPPGGVECPGLLRPLPESWTCSYTNEPARGHGGLQGKKQLSVQQVFIEHPYKSMLWGHLKLSLAFIL